jgi:magnesium transporter
MANAATRAQGPDGPASDADGRRAADLMVADVPRAAADELVEACRERLLTDTFEDASNVVVLDGTSALGVVPCERLLATGPDGAVGSLADARAPVVRPGDHLERAASDMVRRGASAIVVADADGNFVGLVPAARLVGLLLTEHDEDIARIGGYRSSAGRDRRAAEEPLGPRLLHRLPWLIVGLAGAMASALLVGAFEEELDEVVLLALFVPAVVYMAAAVGAQTQTLLIRALSTDVDVGRVFRQELITGIVLGAATAAAFYPFALIVWGDKDVALTVALALFASSSIATVIAVALPLGLRRLGQDPAFGSGPLATVIQDLVSIAIYFAIAVPVAT